MVVSQQVRHPPEPASTSASVPRQPAALPQSLPPPPPAPASPSAAFHSTLAMGGSEIALAVVAPSTGCARLRKSRRLVYAAHSGFGNQEMALRRALLVSYVLNRTLVVPPILHQADLSYGPPEARNRLASCDLRDLCITDTVALT